ncbi:MAG: hypothetical protein AAGA30_06510 [Planctomycetota bacterium]
MSPQKFRKLIFNGLVMALLCVMTAGHSFAQFDQGSGTTGPPIADDPFQSPSDLESFQLPTDIPGLGPGQPGGSGIFQAPTFQDTLANEKYAGWRQVSDGSDGNRLDETLRSQWVMADERGGLSGVVYGIEGADVGNLKINLLSNGKTVTSINPTEDGSFTFTNVREGTYAIVGWGDNAFFAFGLNILKFNEAFDENVPTSLKITATPNETTINTDWIQFFSKQVKFPIYGRYETGQEETDDARLYGIAGQSLFLPESRPSTSVSSHQVIPAADGRVLGRVHQISTRDGRPVDIKSTRILLLKDDDVYAAVSTDAYGAFEFPSIPAGEYSVVAVGQDGIGAIGIYLGEPGDSTEEGVDYVPISFSMTPSETTGWLNDMAIEEAYRRVITRPIVNYDNQQQAGCSSCGRSGCNSGCGGGGGALRPGGYRPPPKSSIPKDQRFLKKANRFLDGLFFRDAEIPPTGGQFQNQNIGNQPQYFTQPISEPMPPAPAFEGSTSRVPIPGNTKK